MDINSRPTSLRLDHHRKGQLKLTVLKQNPVSTFTARRPPFLHACIATSIYPAVSQTAKQAGVLYNLKPTQQAQGGPVPIIPTINSYTYTS